MADYPVMFTVRDTVSGNGFLAGVTLTGPRHHEPRGKMENGGVLWCTARQQSPKAARHLRKRSCASENSYKNVLFDFAERFR